MSSQDGLAETTDGMVQNSSASAGAPLPASLLRKQREALSRAKEYRSRHGNPIDNLVSILGQIGDDGELWRAIVDEPYG
jgi:hypothetical protein